MEKTVLPQQVASDLKIYKIKNVIFIEQAREAVLIQADKVPEFIKILTDKSPHT